MKFWKNGCFGKKSNKQNLEEQTSSDKKQAKKKKHAKDRNRSHSISTEHVPTTMDVRVNSPNSSNRSHLNGNTFAEIHTSNVADRDYGLNREKRKSEAAEIRQKGLDDKQEEKSLHCSEENRIKKTTTTGTSTNSVMSEKINHRKGKSADFQTQAGIAGTHASIPNECNLQEIPKDRTLNYSTGSPIRPSDMAKIQKEKDHDNPVFSDTSSIVPESPSTSVTSPKQHHSNPKQYPLLTKQTQSYAPTGGTVTNLGTKSEPRQLCEPINDNSNATRRECMFASGNNDEEVEYNALQSPEQMFLHSTNKNDHISVTGNEIRSGSELNQSKQVYNNATKKSKGQQTESTVALNNETMLTNVVENGELPLATPSLKQSMEANIKNDVEKMVTQQVLNQTNEKSDKTAVLEIPVLQGAGDSEAQYINNDQHASQINDITDTQNNRNSSRAQHVPTPAQIHMINDNEAPSHFKQTADAGYTRNGSSNEVITGSESHPVQSLTQLSVENGQEIQGDVEKNAGHLTKPTKESIKKDWFLGNVTSQDETLVIPSIVQSTNGNAIKNDAEKMATEQMSDMRSENSSKTATHASEQEGLTACTEPSPVVVGAAAITNNRMDENGLSRNVHCKTQSIVAVSYTDLTNANEVQDKKQQTREDSLTEETVRMNPKTENHLTFFETATETGIHANSGKAKIIQDKVTARQGNTENFLMDRSQTSEQEIVGSSQTINSEGCKDELQNTRSEIEDANNDCDNKIRETRQTSPDQRTHSSFAHESTSNSTETLDPPGNLQNNLNIETDRGSHILTEHGGNSNTDTNSSPDEYNKVTKELSKPSTSSGNGIFDMLTVDDVKKMTVRQLKKILEERHIQIQAGEEKRYLVEQVTQLIKQPHSFCPGESINVNMSSNQLHKTEKHKLEQQTESNNENLQTNKKLSISHAWDNESSNSHTVMDSLLEKRKQVSTDGTKQKNQNFNEHCHEESRITGDHRQSETSPVTNIDLERIESLEDIPSPHIIQQLGVRQIKSILKKNWVTFDMVQEKRELVTKLEQLWYEKNQERGEEVTNENLCRICLSNEMDCVFLECGHMLACTDCGHQIEECPVCRQYIVRAVHLFKVNNSDSNSSNLCKMCQKRPIDSVFVDCGHSVTCAECSYNFRECPECHLYVSQIARFYKC